VTIPRHRRHISPVTAVPGRPGSERGHHEPAAPTRRTVLALVAAAAAAATVGLSSTGMAIAAVAGNPAKPGTPTKPAEPAPALNRPTPSWRIKPTRDNTGVPAGWQPASTVTGTNGRLTLRTDNAVYEDVRFACAVDVQARNVTFRRCAFVGGNPIGAYVGLLRFTDARTSNALVEDCTVRPDTPSVQWNGITGHDFTARRVQLRDVVDCFEVFNTADPDAATNVLIEGCWGGDFHFLSSAAAPAGLSGWPSDRKTHNDWCQIEGGSGTHLHYNTMASFAGPTSDDQLGVLPPGRQTLSNLMIKGDVGSISDLNIHDNWCSGGNFAFNLADRTNAPARPLSPSGRSLGSIKKNKFATGPQSFLNRGISMPPTANVDTGSKRSEFNVYDGVWTAIPVYHNG